MGWIRICNWIQNWNRKICSWIRIRNKLFQIHNTDFYTFKGTMSHDFRPSFIRILTHLSQLFIGWGTGIFADGFIFGKKTHCHCHLPRWDRFFNIIDIWYRWRWLAGANDTTDSKWFMYKLSTVFFSPI